MSDSVRPHRWQPTRLPRSWDSPGKNSGVGCHFLLQCIKVKREVAQSCLTLSDPMDCSLPGSSVHGIFQARVLEWGEYPNDELTHSWSKRMQWSTRTGLSVLWELIIYLISIILQASWSNIGSLKWVMVGVFRNCQLLQIQAWRLFSLSREMIY